MDSYERYEHLRKSKGLSNADVAKATGISDTTLSAWKLGKYTPKPDKMKILADFFGVSRSVFMDEEEPKYYLNEETAQIAEAIFENHDLYLLFYEAKDASADKVKLATEMFRMMKATNPDG